MVRHLGGDTGKGGKDWRRDEKGLGRGPGDQDDGSESRVGIAFVEREEKAAKNCEDGDNGDEKAASEFEEGAHVGGGQVYKVSETGFLGETRFLSGIRDRRRGRGRRFESRFGYRRR